MENSFKNKFLNGEIEFSSIYDYIEVWHSMSDIRVPLREYLGLSKDEYNDFVTRPERLEKHLIEERDGR